MVEDEFPEYARGRWPRLVRAARLMGCTREEAEDLVQETLVKTYANWRRVTAAADPDAYVHQILFNQFRTARRRRWKDELASADPTERMIEPSDPPRGQDRVIEALHRLSHDHRQVLVLRYYLDRTEQQTADALGVSIGTVKSRHSRAVEVIQNDPTLMSLLAGGDPSD